MNFRQIEAFRYVMITGTTKGAASRLFVTQPAISRMISALEADLGFSLFNRHKGRLQPTMTAVRFYKGVEQNFLGLERLERLAGELNSSEPKELNIACTPALSTTLLPVAIKAFHEKNPDVLISIDTATVSQILDRLQYLRIDMAITLCFPPIAGIECEPLIETEIYCAMPRGHRLSDQSVITPLDFIDERVINTLSVGPIKWDDKKIFEDAGIKLKHTIAYHTSHTGYAMIAHGMGIGLMEPFSHEHWREKVTLRPFRPRLPLTYSLGYPTSMVRSQLTLDFCKIVKNVFNQWHFTE